MATVILVHGGWSAGWVWKYNVDALKEAGYNVIAVDLPGHGDNHQEKLTQVHLNDYVEHIEGIIKDIDDDIILAAHSMTGMVIAQIAENLGEKIKKLFFIAAFMPALDTKNMLGYMKEDPWSCVGEKTIMPLENGMLTFVPEYLRNLAFGLCDDEKYELALMNLQPETPAMWGDDITLGDNYKKVPKYYFHTLKDNCCTYYMQRVMVKETPVVKQYYLDADHFCMFSASKELNESLIDALSR